MIRCLHCGAETSNGLALCDLCRRKAQTDLEFIPVYFQNLARWRPGRAGGRPVPGSVVLYDGAIRVTNDRISRALDETGADLAGLARQLHDDRGIDLPEGDGEAAQAVAVCALLSEYLTSISTLDWAGDFVTSLGRIEGWLRDLTERYVPGWYAGACRQCGCGTYVVPGLTWVTCGGCGTTTYARDHLDTILDEARAWTGRPKVIAGTLVALLDREVSVERLYDRIRKWDSLGWLEPIRRLDLDGDPVGAKLYRFGDVLDLASGEADAPTRRLRMTAS